MTTHNKGFIALFFTLSISSILMAYVASGSEKVFAYMRAKELFTDSRQLIRDDLECADQFVNILIQTYTMPSVFSNCTIEHSTLNRIDSNTLEFSFKIHTREFKGTIFQGFITDLENLNFSL